MRRTEINQYMVPRGLNSTNLEYQHDKRLPLQEIPGDYLSQDGQNVAIQVSYCVDGAHGNHVDSRQGEC